MKKLKFSNKKGASVYMLYWLQLKENPNYLVTYQIVAKYHPRFTKAIKKRKYMDAKFKKQYPNAILKFYRYETYIKAVLILNSNTQVLL